MSSTIAIASLDNTFGCLLLASVLTVGLWGAGSVQLYYFFDRYGNDPLYMKLHVFTVWALDTAQQALILASTYTYLVTNYANVAQLAKFETMLRDTIILTGFICALVQSVFIVRIYRLSKKNLIVTGVIGALAIAQFACTLVYYAKCYSFTTFTELRSISSMMRTVNIVTTVADAAIAAVLIYLFHFDGMGFKRNDNVVNKFMTFTVNTGALITVCALVCLITSVALPNTFLYFLFYLLLSRLYMNSMLAFLNSRHTMRGKGVESSNTPRLNYSMNDIHNNRPDVSSRAGHPAAPRIVTIKVDTETFLDNEMQKDLGRSDSDVDVETSYAGSKRTAY